MKKEDLIKNWKIEEENAIIHGWEFSHIEGRCKDIGDLPWDYNEIVKDNLKKTDKLLDIDTGGGEFLLSLQHEYSLTSATEGYKPNVILCKEKLIPLGIDFKEARDYSNLPFEDNQFDVVINRHGSFDANEIYRILKPGGLFITQQVGEENDRELIELLLPKTPKAFSGMNLKEQVSRFIEAGFEIDIQKEAFRPMRFYDTGALIWFAKVIPWEFIDFTVAGCLDNLFRVEEMIKKDGFVQGITHRYLIVAKKHI